MFEVCGQRLGHRCLRVLCSPATTHQTLFSRQYSAAREARFMKKLITSSQKVKKKWYGVEPASVTLKDLSFLSSAVPSTRTDARQKPAKVHRRVSVLNNVFMEQVSSLLATGEVATEILGLGMEITEVRVSPDFSGINVYWFGTGTEKDEALEHLLKGIGMKLRHVLSQLRVIGCVPPVTFVKDTKYCKLMQVQKLLSQVDLGEDFVPTSLGADLRTPPQPPPFDKGTRISKSLQNALLDLDGTDSADTGTNDALDETQPRSRLSSENMRQDILGLDRTAVMAKIELSLSRVRRKLNRDLRPQPQLQSVQLSETQPPLNLETTEQVKETARAASHRQDQFLNYLKKKRIAKSKDDQRMSTEAREREFLEEERRERWLQSQGLLFNETEFELTYKDEDFIDDEDHENSSMLK